MRLMLKLVRCRELFQSLLFFVPLQEPDKCKKYNSSTDDFSASLDRKIILRENVLHR